MCSMANLRNSVVYEPYVGETQKRIREGYGVYCFENGFFRYEGEWSNGKKHGHGKLFMADGSFYEGQFQRGEIIGHGTKFFASKGSTYSGEFHMGELHGQGVMNYADGSVYEGQWQYNKRVGHGIFRSSDTSVYQGYYNNNVRHGEGTQIYSNGDRYDGDWINDKRQGHGEFRQSDGTHYDGQWRNDHYNGQGSMAHCSGIIYEGLWLNGYPALMATKITVKTDMPTLEVTQGKTFNLEVILVNDENEIIEENGRELAITAGFKVTADKPTAIDSSESYALFDVIEDVEEKPDETPFGYSVVSYPLTDSDNPDQHPELVEREITEVSERNNDGESRVSLEQSRSDIAQSSITEDETVPSSEKTSGSPDTAGMSKIMGESFTLPPPVSNQKTKAGMVNFQNLLLPPPPPMYRPFILADLEEQRDPSGKASKTGRKASKHTIDEKSQALKSKKSGDEKYARVGEYVLMIKDVTNPPFMDMILEPAYIRVNIVLPKKNKKKATGSTVKNSGPNSVKNLSSKSGVSSIDE